MADLIKIYFYLFVLDAVFTILVVAIIALTFAFVHFIRLFCESCFNFFFNREDDNEP